MKENHQLDILNIKTIIRQKHKEFVEKVGSMPDIINDSNSILIFKMYAKICAILCCLKDEGVIDDFNYDFWNSHGFFYPKKNNYFGSLVIIMNGKQIIIKSSSTNRSDALENSSLNSNIIINVEDIDKYDWESFAMILLEYIHDKIYSRKDAIDMALFGIGR